MDVSHFELIFKPQSPADPVGAGPVDSVLQGYFLEITNFEAQELRFALEFVISPAATPERDLAGNALVFVDTPPGTDNQQGVLNGAAGGSVFRPSTGTVRIPPLGTALVALLPSAFGPVPGDCTPLTIPNFEVRGHVRIRLPAVLEFNPGGFPFVQFVPQAQAPVRVLLTPQNRATYFKGEGGISDQTQASLPLATGQAEYLIDPESGGPLVLTAGDINVETIKEIVATELDEENTLAALLARLDPEGAGLAGFNKALAKANIPFAIERRSKKSR
jgi:hypothetical protein